VEKIVVVLCFLTLLVYGEKRDSQEQSLQNACLSCHQQQQIPSSLIYRRYLMRYSTSTRMEEAIFSYLKHPLKEHSIMPSAFFLKFPMKKKTTLDDSSLHRYIKVFLETFDIKKRLLLEESNSL
jgi:hypothetical protein